MADNEHEQKVEAARDAWVGAQVVLDALSADVGADERAAAEKAEIDAWNAYLEVTALKVAIHAVANEVLASLQAWLEEATPGVRAIVMPEDTKITILRPVQQEEES